MTQEEKARAYDEALERAKEQIKECGDNEGRKKMIRNIFPELHESEDEKTRKALIQFLNDIKSISESGRTSWAIRKEDAEICNGFITYLEKQKEQKPETFNEPYNPDDYEVVMEGNATSLKRKEQKSVDYDHEMWKNCEANFEGGKKEVIEHPEKYGLQKPAEWSEEDESELTAVIYCVSRAIKASKDENERNSLLSAKKWLQDKLSFRVKSLRPSWKPSEEQMKHLEYYVTTGSVSLKSLYEQLKKL